MKVSNSTEFIEKSIEKYGNLYCYNAVNYINAYTPVTIICLDHGEFQKRPNFYLNGQACPYCNGNKLNTQMFINRANIVHSFRYNYMKTEYKGAMTKLIIICNIHGEFEQTPNCHLRGKGCSKCAGFNKTTEDYIKEAIIVHGYRYDYSLVKYTKASNKIIIICKKHGKFKQKAGHHLLGHGCPDCGGSKVLGTEEFIIRSVDIHGSKYDYSEVEYININTDVIIICPIHGKFNQKPREHLVGCGCQLCADKRGEKLLKNILNNIYDNKYKFKKARCKNNINPKTGQALEYDCYCKELNLAVEYQGHQHYEFPNRYHKTIEEFKTQQLRDKIKKENSIKNGIKLILFKEFGWFNKKHIIDRMLTLANDLGVSEEKIIETINLLIR